MSKRTKGISCLKPTLSENWLLQFSVLQIWLESYHDSENLLSQDPKEKEPPQSQNRGCRSPPSWLCQLWKMELRVWKAEQSFCWIRGVGKQRWEKTIPWDKV